MEKKQKTLTPPPAPDKSKFMKQPAWNDRFGQPTLDEAAYSAALKNWRSQMDSFNMQVDSNPYAGKFKQDWNYDKNTQTWTNKNTGEELGNAGFYTMINAQAELEEKKAIEADFAKRGLYPDGSPIAPEFQSMIDPATGKLRPEFQTDLQELDPNTLEGYNMIKKIAQQQGPSDWAQTANKQAEMRQQDTIEAAMRQAASSNAAAVGGLAMRGGAGSGQRERLAMSNQRNLLGERQSAYRTTSGSLLDIMKSDEEMKRQAMSQFAEGEGKIQMGNLGIRNQEAQINQGNVLKDWDLKNAWAQDRYKAELDKYAAERQAEATAKSGGGGK